VDVSPNPPNPIPDADRGINLPEITNFSEISRLPHPPAHDARNRGPENPASRKNAGGSKENAKKIAAKGSVKAREASPVVNDAGIPVSLPSKKERKGHLTAGLLPIKIMEPPFRVPGEEPQGMDVLLLKEQSPVKYELRESPDLGKSHAISPYISPNPYMYR
jgi:hypothetical protein